MIHVTVKFVSFVGKKEPFYIILKSFMELSDIKILRTKLQFLDKIRDLISFTHRLQCSTQVKKVASREIISSNA